ncbi:MAG: trigger factor [Sedimentisphaerales bacterium]
MPEEEQATAEASDEESVAKSTEAEGPKNIVTIEEVGPCKKKVIIEIPEEAIKNATDEQYNKLRKEALVPGFRKGRAPRRLLEKRFGKEAMEQVKLKLLAKASESAIKDNELATLGEPDFDVENIELPDTGSLKFDFEVEVRPEFDLPPLEGIPVSKTKLEVTDQQIDREIEQLQRWSGIWTPREAGVVELDDQIIADVVLRAVSPQDASPQNAVEGAEANSAEAAAKAEDVEEQQKLDNIEIYVRQNGFVGPIPVEKLDELLVGTKAGDVKQTTVDVPKTYFREEYRGKKVDIQITVKDIKWLKPAALDENFLRRYNVEDENELQEKIRDILQSRLEQQGRTEMTEQIYEYLLDNTNFDLPLDIVAEQSNTLLRRQYGNLIMRGLPREQIEQQMDQLRASSEQQAKEQLKTFFIMDKVADKLEIDVTEEEINGHIARLAIQRRQRPERMREEMQRDGSLAQFSLQVRENKCIAKLLESANITEKKAEKAKKSAKKQKDKTQK